MITFMLSDKPLLPINTVAISDYTLISLLSIILFEWSLGTNLPNDANYGIGSRI